MSGKLGKGFGYKRAAQGTVVTELVCILTAMSSTRDPCDGTGLYPDCGVGLVNLHMRQNCTD